MLICGNYNTIDSGKTSCWLIFQDRVIRGHIGRNNRYGLPGVLNWKMGGRYECSPVKVLGYIFPKRAATKIYITEMKTKFA